MLRSLFRPTRLSHMIGLYGCSGAGGSRVKLARHGHGGLRQAWHDLRTQQRLEQQLRQPIAQRGDTPVVLSSASSASSSSSHPQPCASNEGCDTEEGAAVASLTHFFDACRRHSAAIGCAKEVQARRQARDEFRRFWATYIDSAVRCCVMDSNLHNPMRATGGRDVGFVATYGLRDDALHLSMSTMVRALHAVVNHCAVMSAVDMMSILHLLARELVWHEREDDSKAAGVHSDDAVDTDENSSGRVEIREGSSGNDSYRLAENQSTRTAAWRRQHQTDCRSFRRALANVAVERVVFFFVQHAPRGAEVQSECATLPLEEEAPTPCATASCAKGTAVVASAEDALAGLEVLARVRVSDADLTVWHPLHHNLIQRRQQQQQQLSHTHNVAPHAGKPDHLREAGEREEAHVPPQPHLMQRNAGATEEAGADPAAGQYDLVAAVFRFVIAQRRQLQFTALIQSYSLLRIFLPLLWPPYSHERSQTPSRAPSRLTDASSELRGDAGLPASVDSGQRNRVSAVTRMLQPVRRRRGEGNVHSADGRTLGKESELLFKISWGLARELRKRDSRFVNPYHFVKVVNCLARLPAFLLSSAAHRKATAGAALVSGGGGALPHPDAASSSSVRTATSSLSPTEARRDRGYSISNTHSDGNMEHRARKVGHTFSWSMVRCTAAGLSAVSPALPHDSCKEDVHLPSAAVAHEFTPEMFWHYLISKACIFVPNLPLPQRRVVCHKLHIALGRKRHKRLGNDASLSSVSSLSAGRSDKSTCDGDSSHNRPRVVVTDLCDTAEDILLPLREEMRLYAENFDMSVQRALMNRQRERTQGGHWRRK